jgi:hypothetical protein
VAVVEGFGVIHAHHPAGGVNPKGTSLKTSAVQYMIRPLSAIGEKGLSVDVQGGPDEEEKGEMPHSGWKFSQFAADAGSG